MSPSSGLKRDEDTVRLYGYVGRNAITHFHRYTKAAYSSEKKVSISKSTRSHNPEGHNLKGIYNNSDSVCCTKLLTKI
jgi:uncharacterized protein YqfB (UPF0267 family)